MKDQDNSAAYRIFLAAIEAKVLHPEDTTRMEALMRESTQEACDSALERVRMFNAGADIPYYQTTGLGTSMGTSRSGY